MTASRVAGAGRLLAAMIVLLGVPGFLHAAGQAPQAPPGPTKPPPTQGTPGVRERILPGSPSGGGAGTRGPRDPECLSAGEGVRRVAVVGLPDALADRVIEHLTEGRRFQPVERKALQAALSEQRHGRPPRQTYLDRTLDKAIKDLDGVEGQTVLVTGALSAYNDLLKELSDLGTTVGAHCLVLGNVEKLAQKSETARLPHTAQRTVGRRVTQARVRLRLVDVKTSTVVGARSVQAEVSEALFNGKGAEPDTDGFLDEVGRRVAATVLDVAFPARIVSLEPLTLSRGSNDGVRAGDLYVIQREGQAIRGETGAVIGRHRSRVGQVEVLEVQENIAVVRPREGVGFRLRDLAVTDAARSPVALAPSGAPLPGSAARVAPPPPAVQGSPGRSTIAVGTFRPAPGAPVAGLQSTTLTNELIVRLANTNRFRVKERQEVDQLLDEKLFQAATAGRDVREHLRQFQGADYLVYGEVTRFQVETTQTRVPYLREVQVSRRGRAEGTLRVVDVATGAVAAADQLRVDEPLDASVDDATAVARLTERLAGEAVSRILARVYPFAVIGIQPDGTVYLSRGLDGGIAIGSTFDVLRPGPEMRDQTGQSFGAAETHIATVEIVDVEPTRSRARIVSGQGPALNDVLRPRLPAPATGERQPMAPGKGEVPGVRRPSF